jgi:uncharacterized membrane protein
MGLLRVLSVVGLAVALFLAGVHLAKLLVVQFSETPFCGFAPNWFDCGAVLFHERWSAWLGIPVAFPAAGLYALVTVAAFALRPGRSPAAVRRLWGLLQLAAVCIAVAAVWFIFVQARLIGEFCLYCMIEHGIGLLLAFQVWAGSVRLRGAMAPGWAPALMGLVAAGGLIAGQALIQPNYSEPMVGEFGEEGGYTETSADAEGAVPLMGGEVVLDRDLHLYLGDPGAEHVIVEAIDYTCPNCRELFETLKAVRPELGSDYAVLVLSFPLNAECNHLMQETMDRHADACYLARLAHAVWMIDAERFPEFHRWLFENQDGMTREAAREKAAELVGHARLMGTLTLDRLAELIARDVEIGRQLGGPRFRLPGLFVGSRQFSHVPSDPETVAKALRDGFEPPEESSRGDGAAGNR